ncbi:FAD-dependent monooxygenase [Rhodococcoides kyotonense]|uniref:2-polyprenyl-6-methoxyphenol hydroxylase n=1 Tax=Rhodococcoides kyotonense TaxID=398843 RepID=A0A239IGY0_9NOCA|nr:FAD-dependent monooxygenase [Rhodococcus kyotonensis]SNS92682.1 2-polyprenyl-6-methoxyphenol hydroxylase [Rhodococcus kyotonensis]
MGVDVLIAGAGPIGLTAAIELRRRGIGCRVVDPLIEPPQYAKAVGVQPRTLEVFENMGVAQAVLDASIPMRGQIAYRNGEEAGRIELSLPPDVPYLFVGLPQYETERILTERHSELGGVVERGVGLASFEQDADGVVATLSDGSTVHAQYLIGCDGAHSVTRKQLGLTFEGGAFAESYMLGDVEVDWSVPTGYGVRSMHVADDGTTDDLLVAIPLPGRKRYRMSMLVPDELAAPPSADSVEHGFTGTKAPELHHIQAVLDRLSPEPTTASTLRWSSVFRISHRIVNAYGRGRVFVAGDAAHIHPPTGAQGMNTGIQDAQNIAWKVALAVRGIAAPGLTDTYDAERRPVGEEIVGMTVRNAREGIGAGENSLETAMRRQAQLLIFYAGSPIVAPVDETATSVQPGERAPDARGLRRDSVAYPIRLFELLATVKHTLLLYADGATGGLEDLASAAVDAAHGQLNVYLVVSSPTDSVVPVIHDADGELAKAYGVDGPSAFVVRPDGYLSHRESPATVEGVLAHLKKTFA